MQRMNTHLACDHQFQHVHPQGAGQASWLTNEASAKGLSRVVVVYRTRRMRSKPSSLPAYEKAGPPPQRFLYATVTLFRRGAREVGRDERPIQRSDLCYDRCVAMHPLSRETAGSALSYPDLA